MTFGALSTRRHRPFWAFLFFVAILTATSVSGGVRALRAKTRTAVHRNAWDVGWPALLTTSSLAAAFYGVSAGHHLFTAFSVIGLFVGSGQLAYWLTPPLHPMHWWFEHMGSMLGSCIAATTAFLVVNAGRLGVETLRRFRTGSDPFTVLHGADECNAVKGSDPVHYSLRNTVCGSSVVARRGEPRNRSGSAAFHGTSFDPDWRLYYAARYERRVRSGHRLDSRHRLQALANAIEHLPRNGTDLELDGSTLIADSGADVKE